MMKLTDIKIVCESCMGRCEIMNPDSELLFRCPMQKIAIWPGNNSLLSLAVKSLVSGRYESIFCKGCVFVDFSVNNIRLLTNEKWLMQLKKTGLMIILITDRHLEQLALYWQLEDQGIANVIYPDANLLEIKKAINQTYYGIRGGADRGTGSKKYLRPLNKLEVDFLNLMFKGQAVKTIALQMNLSTKKVYNLKAAIMRKMSIKQNLLITS